MSLSLSHVLCLPPQAFSSAYVTLGSAIATLASASGWVSVTFGQGVPLAPGTTGTTAYIAYRNSLLQRQSVANAYASPIANAGLTYLNSWFQYPPNGTAFLSYPPMVRGVSCLLLFLRSSILPFLHTTQYAVQGGCASDFSCSSYQASRV